MCQNLNEENILVGLMSVICRTRTCSIDEVVRVLLTDDTLEDNRFIADFRKFDLLESFWNYVEQQFGYSSPAPALEKFVISMFVSYADRTISTELPGGWKELVSYKSGNIIAFMDDLMNNVLYRDKYDELSVYVAGILDAGTILSAYESETLVECDIFAEVDIILIHWIKERLLAEDLIVSDVVKGTTYKLYFLSEDNGNHSIEKISNENSYVADKRDEDVQKRLFRMRFTFKNKKYDKGKKYYLVAYDENNNVEAFRHEVIMDVAFINDF